MTTLIIYWKNWISLICYQQSQYVYLSLYPSVTALSGLTTAAAINHKSNIYRQSTTIIDYSHQTTATLYPCLQQQHNYGQQWSCQGWIKHHLCSHPFCIVINSYLWDLFQMMGRVLTLTRRSGLVKIVSSSAEYVSVAGLCFCWILALCHTHNLPLP